MTLKHKLRWNFAVIIFIAVCLTYIAVQSLLFAFSDSNLLWQTFDIVLSVGAAWAAQRYIRQAFSIRRQLRHPLFYLAAIQHDLGGKEN